MKQSLGAKKKKRVEDALGKSVLAAHVRGGWPVNWCKAYVDERNGWWVNFKTGEVGHQCLADGRPASLYLNNQHEMEVETAKVRYLERVERLRTEFARG